MGNKYTEDYYERGLESGLSCYQKYRWLPEVTIPAVMSIIDFLGIKRNDKVLDFGCAKGYYVKAFRMLYREAWGCDISEYAISNADKKIRKFIKLNSKENFVPFDFKFDFIIAKDVLEHLDEESVRLFLEHTSYCSDVLFIVVPLAKNGKYIVPTDEKDVTHNIRLTEEGWLDIFNSSSWFTVESFTSVPGIKEHQSVYKGGVGFFVLTN